MGKGEEFSLNADVRSLVASKLKSRDTNRNNQPPLSPELYKLHKPTASESAFSEIINVAVTNCIGQVAV